MANKIIPLLKSGSEDDVKTIQTWLGMKGAAVDGKFGKKTLANLEAGKIVESKKVASND
ncbi:MAG: hypothetical protein WCH65_00005 [bacterium]